MKKIIRITESELISLVKGIINEQSKEYTFETPAGFFEYYDIRKARKKALEIAKEINDEVLVTCMHKPSYKQDWFTAYPDGNWTIDMKGFRADN